MKTKQIFHYVAAATAVILIAVFPGLLLWTGNVKVIPLKEIFEAVLPYIGFNLLLTAIGFVVTKNIDKAAIFTVIVFLGFANFRTIEQLAVKIWGQLQYWHVAIILVWMFACVFVFLCRLSTDKLPQITKIVSLSLTGLFLFNMIFYLPQMPKTEQINTNPEQLLTETVPPVEISDSPNVYWLLYDEYSSFNNIEKYYGYDNGEFRDFLKNLGFSVSDNSFNNSASTHTVITNYVNLDYIVNDGTSLQEKNELRTPNAPIFKLFQSYGYEVRFAGFAEFFSAENAVDGSANVLKSSTVNGESVEDILLKQTILYPLLSYGDVEAAKLITDTVNYLSEPGNFPQESTFTIAYMLLPHQPFIFDELGNMNSVMNYDNWVDPQYYLGSYIYATNTIKRIVTSIIESDPSAIIIVQSDHSARYTMDGFERIVEAEDPKNILNAVYLGENNIVSIDGLDGVNTLRIVCNEVLGTDFELLF